MMWRIISIVLLLAVLSSCGRSRSPEPPRPTIDYRSNGLESPAAAERIAPAIAAENNLGYVQKYVGRYPRSVKLFDTEPLHEQLTELLGEQYPTFLRSMQVTSPLKRSEAGIYYLAGRDRGADNYNRAYLLIDPVLNQMEAGLILQGNLKRFQGTNNEIPVPPEIRMLVEGARFRLE